MRTRLYQIISWIFTPPLTLSAAFFLAATLSFSTYRERIFWAALISIITFGIAGLYFLFLLLRKRVDLDIKNQQLRQQFYKILVLGLLCAFVIILFLTEAPLLEETIFIAVIISTFFVAVLEMKGIELSFHIGMLTLVVIFISYYVSRYFAPIGALALFFTGYSRYKLHMHTLLEVTAGFIASLVAYIVVLML